MCKHVTVYSSVTDVQSDITGFRLSPMWHVIISKKAFSLVCVSSKKDDIIISWLYSHKIKNENCNYIDRFDCLVTHDWPKWMFLRCNFHFSEKKYTVKSRRDVCFLTSAEEKLNTTFIVVHEISYHINTHNYMIHWQKKKWIEEVFMD